MAVPTLCASLCFILTRFAKLAARPALICLLIDIKSIAAFAVLWSAEGWVSGNASTSALVQHWIERLGITGEAEIWT